MSNNFGWDYPPGCNSTPYDDEEEDERGWLERQLDRWLGIYWTFKRHYLISKQKREAIAFSFNLTMFWVYALYFHQSKQNGFTLRLSLIRAGQTVCRDEQRAQLVLVIKTDFLWETLGEQLIITLKAAKPPIEEQLWQPKPSNDWEEDTGMPLRTLLAWKFETAGAPETE